MRGFSLDIWMLCHQIYRSLMEISENVCAINLKSLFKSEKVEINILIAEI